MRVNRALAPLLVVLSACSGKSPAADAGVDAGVDAGPTCLDPDAGPPADAGGFDGGDFSCKGMAPPAGAVQELRIGGTVTVAALMRSPVPGAKVELFDEAGTLLDTSESNADGGYTVKHDIGCAPFNGYVRGSHPDAGYYDFYYYPPAPWRRGRTDLELALLNDATRNLATLFAMVTITPGMGAIALGVEDCTRTPITGATIAVMPSGDVRYVAGNGIPVAPSMQSSTSPKGQALIFNVPPGSATVTVTVAGQTLTRTVAVRADAITTTTLVP